MSKNSSSNGIGFFTLLFLIFLVLKLTDVIDWSWWLVTAPIWGPFAFAIVATVTGFMLWAIIVVAGKFRT